MTRQLLGLAWWFLLAVTLLAALLPRRPSEPTEVAFRRRRFYALTGVVALILLPLVWACVVSLPLSGPPNPFGLMAFVLLCATSAAAFLILRSVRRRLQDAVAAEQLAAVRRAFDAPPPRHAGLSGDEPPPTRW